MSADHELGVPVGKAGRMEGDVELAVGADEVPPPKPLAASPSRWLNGAFPPAMIQGRDVRM
jgi:hypothetical protein